MQGTIRQNEAQSLKMMAFSPYSGFWCQLGNEKPYSKLHKRRQVEEDQKFRIPVRRIRDHRIIRDIDDSILRSTSSRVVG